MNMNGSYFPVSKSFLCDEALARVVEVEYGLPGSRCQLITATMRDVYLVRSNEMRHVLFVYRQDERSADEIRAEWEFVGYLHAHGVKVAPAIARKNGELLLTFDAPEGTRYGVLTHYVEGKHLRHRPSIEAIRTYGRLIAKIHTLSDASAITYTRPKNQIERILKQSIGAFELEVSERAQDIAYLHECAAILLPKVDALPKQTPYYGMIHGDVIRGNAQISDDGGVTILDFDLCGAGWRAYDIASYLLVIRGSAEEDASQRAFLSGYQEIRPLSEIERETLPLFEAVRAIFSIGIPAMNLSHWGSAYLHAFLDHELDRLKQAMKRIEPKN